MSLRRLALPLLAGSVWVVLLAGHAWAHGDEASIPAQDSFATAMALLQVQPDMTEMIGDKIGDGLESDDVQGVDLSLARQAQQAFEAGDDTRALDLLSRAAGLTPAEALAVQTEDVTRPSEVPVADQLGSPGSAGRPSTGASVALAVGAIIAMGLGGLLVRITR